MLRGRAEDESREAPSADVALSRREVPTAESGGRHEDSQEKQSAGRGASKCKTTGSLGYGERMGGA